jgi:hypothetical protein
MTKYAILLIVIIALAISAGCVLSSGTMILTYEAEGYGAIGGGIQSVYVDLSSEKDFEKHKDKIESIDAVSIVGDIANTAGTTAGAEIWITDNEYNNPDTVMAHGTRIFVTPNIALGDTLNINYANGLSYIQNLDVLKSKVENGTNFYVYGIPNGTAVLWYHLGIIITMTAGL